MYESEIYVVKGERKGIKAVQMGNLIAVIGVRRNERIRIPIRKEVDEVVNETVIWYGHEIKMEEMG